MKNKYLNQICILFFLILGFQEGTAQYSTKELNPYHQKYFDSLKVRDYPYTFPLFAKKVFKRGFDIPFTYGISSAFYVQRQDVKINKTLIGFGDNEPVDFTNFIRFGNIESKAQAFTVRPDMWVFPFLNIYGIFGIGKSETKVPLVRPINFETAQNFDVTSYGFGITLAGGIGPVFLVVDNNLNFANTDALVEPVPAYNLDIRVGHNFVNPKRADRGIAIWFGTFYQRIGSDTEGSIKISDVLPNGGQDLADNAIDHLNEWADGLPPAQQIVANRIIEKIENYLNETDLGDTEITYKLDKELEKPWNLIFGAQYQHNKHWQLRTEIGTFGARTSFLIMINYRFEKLF